MKTHALASQLEILAKVLKGLPNQELSEDLINEFGGLFQKRSPAKKKIAQKVDIESLIKLVDGKSSREIQAELNSIESQLTAVELIKLADHLRIPVSKRQSKAAIINMIVRHHEARQMHSIMRGTRTEE